MIAYGLLALGLSSVLAVVTWNIVSKYLTEERETSAWVQTKDNAAAFRFGIYGSPTSCMPVRERSDCGVIQARPGVSVMSLLSTLPSTDSAASMVYFDNEWYSLSGRPEDLPPELIALVRGGTAGDARLTVNGQRVLAVGVPVSRPGEAFFEWHPLTQLDDTLRTLKITLVAAAIATALIGLAVGRLASTLALRPLAELTKVADAVSRGRLDARLDAENDRDLGGLARSFNQTAANLERRVEADARFAGDVSHELRTPLMTMLNSMQLIQNHRDELPEPVREPVDLLGDDLERFRRLVIDLLEISRDDGGDRGSREIVRIADLVRAAADATAGRPVTTVAPGAELLTMQADKRRLERVVANLVENAEDHAGGCKGVTVAPGGLGVVITVDDAGPGIAPEDHDRIFERFARTESSSRGRGVGLGLAIVARHVQWHQGAIHLTTRPTGGARFTIDLPAH
ncbi:HAMP domain-containing histidine kinase [Kribbella sandramycini]|uniref:histidine kinase n=1 Tax=Kribbella sandramycini TaxID=60450 RepID=A0A7Y4NYI4_9ACTN|nr:HAMP domain-containing sensor histidine kinase [Kribbella sandramycini]MBB6567523.1 signal transduction histidine kinase [Kribbella sandramycini]NOL39873.1 HAMP domain-containing histidine kinase [Kribbella sandramycini]